MFLFYEYSALVNICIEELKTLETSYRKKLFNLRQYQISIAILFKEFQD